MQTTISMCERFARLLSYPTEEYAELVLDCAADSSNEHLSQFAAETNTLSHEEFEELYTRTFDINPVATLEIGWHLYGETYERGSFLVKMRQLLKELGIPETSELPDHLTHLLRALDTMGLNNDARELVARYVAPALEKILNGFQGKRNPYEHLLRALQQHLNHHFLQGVERHDV
jgi:nitrate reductase delta subunit